LVINHHILDLSFNSALAGSGEKCPLIAAIVLFFCDIVLVLNIDSVQARQWYQTLTKTCLIKITYLR